LAFGALRARIPAVLDSQTRLLDRYLDLLAAQQELTTTNIANADTPGYRTRRVDFSWELRRIAGETADQPGSPPMVLEERGLAANNDGNNVSLDRELRVLAETGIRYTFAAQRVRGNIRSLRDAIREGRGG
jgi:flagellar basal-body rod protein FlgB